MILDTTFVIDVMKNDHAALQKLQDLLAAGIAVGITAPTIFELFNGLAQSSKPALEQEKIDRALHDQIRWPLDDASAERSGKIKGNLATQGIVIGSVDAMIAGISLQHNEPVLTRNVKDFSRVSGLKVETY